MNAPNTHSQGVEVLNRHDFWRACYATMLAEIRPEHIVEFFEKIPMVMEGKRYEVRDLLNLFWNEKGMVNMDWNFHSIHPLEPFLVEKGYDALGFFRKMLHRNNRATYMPGKVVLNWFYPVMDKFLTKYDPREMVLKMVTTYSENYVPGILHRRIKKTFEGDWIRSYMLFITHKRFNDRYVFNYDFIVGEQIRAFPKMMDLPEFESIALLGDCQRIEDILWCDGLERNSKGIWSDGRQIAFPDRYHAYMERGGFDIAKFNIPDRPIMVAMEDIHCPKRNRQVIYKDCAYETPAYLSVIRHKKISDKDRKVLQHMLKDTMLEDELFSAEVCRSHDDLMKSLEKVSAFIYYPADESITLNGEHLVKGVPAKILRSLITAYLKDGRCEFEYREFKRDFEISLGQKNSNFEVRFYRLVEKLEEKCPSIVIEKIGRGRFLLKVTSKLTLED
jgi:hypothetical protein